MFEDNNVKDLLPSLFVAIVSYKQVRSRVPKPLNFIPVEVNLFFMQ
jgi:hypothetical protein